MNTVWFRINPDFKQTTIKRVDRDNRIIYGVAVVTEGDAKGHGVQLDKEFLEKVSYSGNKDWKTGVKSRFGHPSISSDGFGTALGRFKDFRVENNKAIADIHFYKNVKGAEPNIEYIMDLAEEDNKAFATSIVFKPGKEYKKDSKGNKIYEDESGFDKIKDKPFATLEKLIAVDFVDEPAANPDGLYSENDLASKAYKFLEENPKIKELLTNKPNKLFDYLKKYNELQGDNMTELNAEMNAELEQLKADKEREIAELKAELATSRNALKQNSENVKLGLINNLIKDLPETKHETVKTKLSKLSIEQLNEFGADIVKAHDDRPNIQEPKLGFTAVEEDSMSIADFAEMQYNIMYGKK